MIVYGDPSYRASLNSLLENLQARFAALKTTSSLDEFRTFLIQAGQLEQGVCDALPGTHECSAVTDAAADAFLSWLHGNPSSDELSALGEAIKSVSSRDLPLTIKVPEGFAFYALYPEQYVAATRLWLAEHPDAQHVGVVGIRSIGTTLSALVSAVLKTEGKQVCRCTVRPSGHPFSREAEIDARDLDHPEWVLIVDEGPGLSGSSMTSVAEALVRAGIAAGRLAFFPGHGNEPGSEASESVREWWTKTPRYVVPTEALRWDGHSLLETLAGDPDARVEDLSGGRWREFVYADPADWPAVAKPFERWKIRVTRRDGSQIFWKFSGLAGPLETTLGFTASPWIEGEPLRRADFSPELWCQIQAAIAEASGLPLDSSEAKASRERLIEMLCWNVHEGFGEEMARRVRRWTEGIDLSPDAKSSGDCRMAPHEWRRLADGRIVKTSRRRGSWDHTVIGRQPVSWDVAGAIVEWDIDEALAGELSFYTAAYAAFQMGMCSLCAAADLSEKERLEGAANYYRGHLLKSLERAGITGEEATHPRD
jgi:hypothetical protein